MEKTHFVNITPYINPNIKFVIGPCRKVVKTRNKHWRIQAVQLLCGGLRMYDDL